jgi:class 3 adenylate cyclase/TolB-like protein
MSGAPTAETAQARKLASIVAIDVAGYSRRTEADEEAAIKAVAALKGQVSRAAQAHGGRVFNTAGDGFMLEFPTASGALAAAEAISLAGDPPVRVGVHLGEVSVTESGDLLGHGVNVAGRIQQMAQPGAVLASGDVKRAIRGPLGERLKPQGSVKLDKMSETLPVFALAPAEGGRGKGRRFEIKGPLAVAAATLMAVVIGLAAWFARDLVSRAGHSVRVALQPFSVEGNDPTLRQLADGITDQAVAVLTENQVQTSRQAAGAGGAAFVLTGSIRRDDQMLKVSANVEDAHDYVVLWSGELARASGEASAFQRQAAARLAVVLKCAANARRDPHAPADADTLSLYLQVCDTDLVQMDLGRLQQLLTLLRQLTARAPRFAPAHARLAYALIFNGDFFPPAQRAEMRRTGLMEAQKAISLNPKNGDAYMALSLLLPTDRRTQKEALLRRALSLSPDSSWANLWYGALLAETGRAGDSLVYQEKAAALDPLDEVNGANVAEALARVGQTRAADDAIQRVLENWPDGGAAEGAQFYIARWEGRFDVALAMQQRDGAFSRQGSDADRKAWQDVLAALNSRDPRRMAEQRKAQIAFANQSPVNRSYAVENLSQLGYVDDAFALADGLQGVQVPVNFPFLFNPSTAPMRRDRRFMALAAKLGLVDYWRSTGKWPDFCSEPGLPYDCKAEAAKAAGHD